MVEFWDAIRDILVVAIPTIIAGVTSYFSVNLWQVKKEKFDLRQKKYELRKQIQMQFQKAIFSNLHLFEELHHKIAYHYSNSWDLDKKSNEVSFSMDIPHGNENLPENIFAEERIKFREKFIISNREIWNFYSTIIIYFDDDELSDKLSNLIDLCSECGLMFEVFMESKDNDDFKKKSDNLEKMISDFATLTSESAKMLANKPLKKMPD